MAPRTEAELDEVAGVAATRWGTAFFTTMDGETQPFDGPLTDVDKQRMATTPNDEVGIYLKDTLVGITDAEGTTHRSGPALVVIPNDKLAGVKDSNGETHWDTSLPPDRWAIMVATSIILLVMAGVGVWLAVRGRRGRC